MNSHTHKETFLKAVNQIHTFLKDKFSDCLKTLPTNQLKGYGRGHNFVRGWSIRFDDLGLYLKVLLPDQFPYVPPRIAIEDISDRAKDFSIEWPHVEDKGLLCLPPVTPSVEQSDSLTNTLMQKAVEFIATFSSDPSKVLADFQDEFISYWTRHKHKNGRAVWSLVEPESDTREVRYVFLGEQIMVADTNKDINAWYTNRYKPQKQIRGLSGLFVKLSQAPVAPFPNSVSELLLVISALAPGALDLFNTSEVLKNGSYLFLLAAPSSSGVGLMGVVISSESNAKNPMRGFTRPEMMTEKIRLQRISESFGLTRHQITRVDHDWIHGRGQDVSQDILKKSSVAVIGCGSLGSHVAVRLAQAGVGKILLIDPEGLESANVGRHVLGIKHMGANKAMALGVELRQRFPHIGVEYFNQQWEVFTKEHSQDLDELNLIVSTIGEWGAEGVLNEWHISNGFKMPILYGWMEPQAAVGHALLIIKNGSCLGCIVNDKGRMFDPETKDWADEHGLKFEPACGAVFQPYGPVDVTFAEALVSELAIATLVGDQQENVHRVHATSTNHLQKLGGDWTSSHLASRPENFTDSFQYEKPLGHNANCHFCDQQQ